MLVFLSSRAVGYAFGGSVCLLLAGAAQAASLGTAYLETVSWLEAAQDGDGAWRSDDPVATAEALLALAEVGRGSGRAGQRASAWLADLGRDGVDFRARAVRALRASGRAVRPLEDFGTAVDGWGPTSPDQAVSAYDTALAIAAIRATGDTTTDLSGPKATVLARQRADGGWGGDGIPETDASGIQSPSDPFVTAEIVRALAAEGSPDGSDFTDCKLLVEAVPLP